MNVHKLFAQGSLSVSSSWVKFLRGKKDTSIGAEAHQTRIERIDISTTPSYRRMNVVRIPKMSAHQVEGGTGKDVTETDKSQQKTGIIEQ